MNDVPPPQRLQPAAIINNLRRVSAYFAEAADQLEKDMGLLDQWPKIVSELKSLRAENADLRGKVAAYATIDGEADALEASATPVAVALAAPAQPPNLIDRLPA